MSRKKRTYIPLSGASEGPTVHEKEKLPPKWDRLQNLYPSRDDGVPALRSDFTSIAAATLQLEAFRALWVGGSVADSKDDFLNSVTYLRNEHTVYFSRLIPYTTAAGTATLRISTYTTGTAVVSSGASAVTGTTTAFLQNVWPGCFIKWTTGGRMYLVSAVTTDTALTIDGTATENESGAFTIYQTWHPTAGDHKLSIQTWGNYGLVGQALPGRAVDITKVAGPWINRVDLFGAYEWALVSPSSSVIGSFVWKSGTKNYCGSKNVEDAVLSTGVWSAGGGGQGPDGNGGTISFSFKTGAYSEVIDGITWTGTYTEVLISGVAQNTLAPIRSKRKTGATTGTVEFFNSWQNIASDGTTTVITTGWDSFTTTDLGTAADNWTRQVKGAPTGGASFFRCVGGVFYSNARGSWMGTDDPSLGWSPVAGLHGAVYVIAGAGGFYAIAGSSPVFSADGMSFQRITGLPDWAEESGGAWHVMHDSTSGLTWLTAHGVAGGGAGICSTTDGSTWTDYDVSGIVTATGVAIKTYLTGWAFGSSSQIGLVGSFGTYLGTPVAPVIPPTMENFEPISQLYRGKSYASVDSYIVLCGTSEWNVDPEDNDNVGWIHHYRRVRWPSPGTTNDWQGEGAGFLDCPGGSAIIDAAPVGHNVILFEADGIGLLQQLGDLDSAFGYRPLKQNLTKISNVLMLDGAAFFVSEGGQLWTTNGVQVTQVPGFDLTEFEDQWNSTDPVWLDYFETYGCIVVFRPKVAGSEHCAYLVGEEGGQITRIILPEWTGTGAVTMIPKSVTVSRVPGAERLWVGYNPDSADADYTVSMYLNIGAAITGVDTIKSGTTKRWHAKILSGELRVVPEGQTTRVHEVELRTHSAGGTVEPDVTIRAKNIEDSAWQSAGDSYGTIALDTDSCDGTGTVFSNIIGVSSGSVFTTPQPASRCRFYKLVVATSTYTGLTLTTDYTLTGASQVTLVAALTAGVSLVAFWDSCPSVKVAAEDYILAETSDSMHRITSVTDYDTLVLDWYLASGSEVGKHLPAVQMATDDGYAVLAMPFTMDGANVEIRIIPRNDASASTRAKIYGLTVTHSPLASEERRR